MPGQRRRGARRSREKTHTADFWDLLGSKKGGDYLAIMIKKGGDYLAIMIEPDVDKGRIGCRHEHGVTEAIDSLLSLLRYFATSISTNVGRWYQHQHQRRALVMRR